MSRHQVINADDLARYHDPLLAILRTVVDVPGLSRRQLDHLLKAYPKDGKGLFSVDELVAAYRGFTETGELPAFDPTVLECLRLKPVRTRSGVTPLTVLTKPFPCPGTCIFCPNDVRMPKSYLADEPGAQRAERNAFDPYLQTYERLQAFHNTGHPTDKIEVIVLGGTWSFYPESYQRWFVWRVFEALNDFGERIDRTSEALAAAGTYPLAPDAHVTVQINDRIETMYNRTVQALYGAALARTETIETATWDQLAAAQRRNEEAACRCVGLVIETRPDYVTPDELIRLRRLGCTKIQLGLQSLNDAILTANRRGHDVEAARQAIHLCRAAGFKIHVHWMPNLHGATPESDRQDFRRLFDNPDFRPDELKIYPCMLIADTELMAHYRSSAWHPYTDAELIDLLSDCVAFTPEYCRLTRIVRDIPAPDIAAGSTTGNLRQIMETELMRRGQRSQDIRAREIGGETVDPDDLCLDELEYAAGTGREVFLQFITSERKVVGFLRLRLPAEASFIPELGDAALIREVHVYGQALPLGKTATGKAQHTGLGTRLIERAAAIAAAHGHRQLAVISAVGTRAYYRSRGFHDGELYQCRDLA
ncbi:MAG: elongator complex protein 3 [Aggregatilineales bacterium]